MDTVSRRRFLKLGGLAALSLALPAYTARAQAETPIGLGRVTRASTRYDQPLFSGKRLGMATVDTVLNVYEEKEGETGDSQNPKWWRVDEGWVHSSFIQPVRNDSNTPSLHIPPDGFLAEVTVPMTRAWINDGQEKPRVAYRFYYSTTHWVDQAVTDKKGKVWYRILDDRYKVYYFVLAEHLRRVPAKELTPLSPEVTDKRIEVDLKQQRLAAYENGQAVFTARLSSGRAGSETPVGEFRVERKRPSRHMAASDGNGFDLPGVPWVSYIYWTGVAFHGTYWHNDYGRPRSRGCINLTPTDAKWIYRWTMPAVPPGEQAVKEPNGTPVVVF